MSSRTLTALCSIGSLGLFAACTTDEVCLPGSFSQTAAADFANNQNTGVAVTSDAVVSSLTGVGTGASGSFAPTSNTALQGENNFSDVHIPQGVAVLGLGTTPVIIRSTGTVQIDGVIDVSGGDGANGRDPANTMYVPPKGGAGPGGFDGGNGRWMTYGPQDGIVGSGPGAGLGGKSWGGGSGGGFAAAGGGGGGVAGGPAYGDAQLTNLQGGSGGGSGSGGAYCASGAGGGGGGVLVIVAPKVIIGATGLLRAVGGTGGSVASGGCGGGGGGSGGVIWIQTASFQNDGALTASGGAGGTGYGNGGAGSDGRIRIDAPTVAGSVTPTAGYQGPLPWASPATTVASLPAGGKCSFGALTFHADTPGGSALTVDVLDGSGGVLQQNISSGTVIGTVDGAELQPTLKLRANFSSGATDPASLLDWSVDYGPPAK